MSKNHDHVALDFGTTKFCLATRNNPITQDISTVSVPASGMSQGMISNFTKCKDALDRLIDIAEKDFSKDIREVFVGISGPHICSYVRSIEYEIDGVITRTHINRMIDEIKSQDYGKDAEVIHVIPTRYFIDDRPASKDPTHLSGQKLAGSFLVMVASKSYISDIIRVCNKSGLVVSSLVAEQLASSYPCIDDDLKDIGITLIDIGGGSSDGIIFQHGSPVSSFSINIGGHFVTRDISSYFSIPIQEAEKIKMLWGLTAPATPQSFTVSGFLGQKVEICSKEVSNIIRARIDELCSLIAKHIAGHISPGGIILTGGGSLLKGLTPHINQHIGIPVYSTEATISALSEHSLSPKYSTAWGILHYADKHHASTGVDKYSWYSFISEKAQGWFPSATPEN